MDQEISIADFFYIIKKNILLIVLLFILIFTLGVHFALQTPPVYEASSQVLVSSQEPSPILTDLPGTKVNTITQAEIIRSSQILGRAQQEIAHPFTIFIEPLKGTDIIEIAVQSNNNAVTMQAANLIADLYVNYTLDAKADNIHYVTTIINQQLDAYQSELDELNLMRLRIEEAQEFTVQEQLRQQTLQQDITYTEQRLNAFIRERDELVRFLEENPSLTVVERGNAEVQIEEYNDKISDLQRSLNELRSQQIELLRQKDLTIEQELEYQTLLQNIETKKLRYNDLLSKREEAGILSADTTTNVQVIQYAETPFIPVKPNIPLNIAIAFVGAFVASFGLAVGKEFLRNTVKGIGEVERTFGPVVMGVLPKTSKTSFMRGKTHYLHHKFKPSSKYSESMRMLRTNLMFYIKEHGLKLISITSSQKSDGKTTTVLNLSMSLANNDYKVLLVDANLRNPMIHKMLSHEKKVKGLSEVILGEISLSEAIHKTDNAHLDVLYAGAPNNSPSELLSSNKMKEICSKLKHMPYDIILVDNTSLQMAESAFMAANSDGVLFIVRHDRTSKTALDHAKRALERLKARVIGVAINTAP